MTSNGLKNSMQGMAVIVVAVFAFAFYGEAARASATFVSWPGMTTNNITTETDATVVFDTGGRTAKCRLRSLYDPNSVLKARKLEKDWYDCLHSTQFTNLQGGRQYELEVQDGTTSVIKWRLHFPAPRIRFTETPPSTGTTSTSASFRFSAAGISSYQYEVDNSGDWRSEGWGGAVNLSGLSVGEHVFRVRPIMDVGREDWYAGPPEDGVYTWTINPTPLSGGSYNGGGKPIPHMSAEEWARLFGSGTGSKPALQVAAKSQKLSKKGLIVDVQATRAGQAIVEGTLKVKGRKKALRLETAKVKLTAGKAAKAHIKFSKSAYKQLKYLLKKDGKLDINIDARMKGFSTKNADKDKNSHAQLVVTIKR